MSSYVENVPTFWECRHSGGDFTPSDPCELLFRSVTLVWLNLFTHSWRDYYFVPKNPFFPELVL